MSKGALSFLLKEGFPICQLRPVTSPTGRCWFSYPLYKLSSIDGDIILSYEELVRMGFDADQRVDPSEYNITEVTNLQVDHPEHVKILSQHTGRRTRLPRQ